MNLSTILLHFLRRESFIFHHSCDLPRLKKISYKSINC